MKVFLAFLLANLRVYAVVINLQCGAQTQYCPNTTQYIKCSIEGESLQWESSAFNNTDIELFGSPVGTVVKNGVFTANMSDKTGNKAVSVISFPNYLSLNGISITCRDMHDGIANTCILNITNISLPSRPFGLSITQVSYNSVYLQWKSIVDNKGFYFYCIKIVPSNNCSDEIHYAASRRAYITNLQPMTTYTFTVQGVNCAGDGLISDNKTFNIIAFRPLSPSFNVCTVFCFSCESYMAYLQWMYAEINKTFYPPLQYFTIHVVDKRGNVTIYNHSQTSGKTFHYYVKVKNGEKVNVSVMAVNTIGKSINNSIVSLNVFTQVIVNLLHIGSTGASIKVHIYWKNPCGNDLDFMIIISYHSQANKMERFTIPYHLLMDENGTTIFLKNLLPNTRYRYMLSVVSNTSLIAEPFEGVFVTLDNLTSTTIEELELQSTLISEHNYWSMSSAYLHVHTEIIDTSYTYNGHYIIKATSINQNQFVVVFSGVITVLAILAFISPFLAVTVVALLTYSIFLKVKLKVQVDNNHMLERNTSESLHEAHCDKRS